jgi:hypothetical protein
VKQFVNVVKNVIKVGMKNPLIEESLSHLVAMVNQFMNVVKNVTGVSGEIREEGIW